MSSSRIWIGMDVHKDTVMAAVFVDKAQEPEIVQQLPNEHPEAEAILRALEPAR